MWSAIASALAAALSYFFGKKKQINDAKNSPEMVANAKANAESKRQDEIETTVLKASTDEKSLEDLRRAASE